MITAFASRLRLAPLLLVMLASGACAIPKAVPRALREREMPLTRVDGQRVRGSQPFVAAAGSPAATLECQDRLAGGSMSIARDGRTFLYRAEWRDCGGSLLLAESTEGTIETRDDQLTLLVHASGGPANFRGTITDSTLTIFELGGRLEFARP